MKEDRGKTFEASQADRQYYFRGVHYLWNFIIELLCNFI